MSDENVNVCSNDFNKAVRNKAVEIKEKYDEKQKMLNYAYKWIWIDSRTRKRVRIDK
ncbi:hypothetical protein [Empedobacter sp.]|uniref:hypothetical protein n=1 Tax=Empedobacter sp. TaxID=1927715 RepID=UPI0028976596|nr:hypothetical protein [Empedobacter sp.]